MLWPIPLVNGAVYFAQILYTIISFVMVNVVYFFSFLNCVVWVMHIPDYPVRHSITFENFNVNVTCSRIYASGRAADFNSVVRGHSPR